MTSPALTAFAMRYNSLSERRSFDATRRSFDTASPALAGGVKNDRFVVGGMADPFVFFLFFCFSLFIALVRLFFNGIFFSSLMEGHRWRV